MYNPAIVYSINLKQIVDSVGLQTENKSGIFLGV